MSRLLFLSTLMIMSLGACATPVVKGNDTGGIIAWSPENQAVAADIAARHCDWYGKQGRVTTVTARYGDYIVFVCRFR